MSDIDIDDVHVWTATLADALTRQVMASGIELLDAGERQALQQHATGQRDDYLLAHVLLRTTLSRYADVAPAEWRFVRTPLGRPELATGQCHRPLRFSIARRDGFAACAVTLGRDVGVDVEALAGREDFAAIAAAFFSPSEQRALRRAAAPRRRELFCRLWTRKEAWLKARGVGLAATTWQPPARPHSCVRVIGRHVVAVSTEPGSLFSFSRAFHHDPHHRAAD
jgi:4'-phosphopantetheinyl transferase